MAIPELEETLLMSKRMLEMWVNAHSGRDILVRERYTDEGRKVYLELVRENDEPQTETSRNLPQDGR